MKAALVLLVLAVSLQLGAAIHCYECSSLNNSMCLDPASYDEETLRRYLHATECGERWMRGHQTTDYFCRKMVQTILHKHHDPEVRVTRGCGWVKHHRACYEVNNEDHLETVCQCTSNLCNAAILPRGDVTTALASITAYAMTFLM